MSDPVPQAVPVPPDEEWAEAYVRGYADGLREILREFLQHVTRGVTLQEIRYIAQSRLSRVEEDVEVKRKGLLSPPRRLSWGPSRRPAAVPPSSDPDDRLPWAASGGSYLFLEERADRAIRFVQRNRQRFGRLWVISQHPPSFAEIPDSRIEVVRASSNPTGGDDDGFDPGRVSGRIISERHGELPDLVYVDALEFLATEFSLETTLKFVNFLTTQAGPNRLIVVVSADRRSFEPRDLSRLQRSFNITL